jgi:hypothetical protein
MDTIKFVGGAKRTQAYLKLKVFLANPGKFCLIILGSRGSGKHFAIEGAFNEISPDAENELCLKALHFIPASKMPIMEEDLNDLFEKHKHQTLIIEDVEQLTIEQQNLLFEALSTTDGTFGIEKKFELRIAFTSSKEVDSLREAENLLMGFFWDRISQLVVTLPSYIDESENVIADFKTTWNKMKFHTTKGFKHLASYPKFPAIERFLEEYAEKFEGGFRDLDKLACMYFNYRIFHYGKSRRILEETEMKIVDEIKDDFFGKSQLHSNSGNELSVFQIRPGFSWDDLIGQFKIQVRNWGKKKCGTLLLAEKELKLGQGTLKNWTEKKVTKSHRVKYEEIKKQKQKN